MVDCSQAGKILEVGFQRKEGKVIGDQRMPILGRE